MKSNNEYKKLALLLTYITSMPTFGMDRDINGELNAAVAKVDLRSDVRLELVEALLMQGANANTEAPTGINPLLYAAWVGDKELCQLLIKYGADVNIQSLPDQINALIIASEKEDEEICKLLIEHKAHVNAQDDRGFTALMASAPNNSDAIARLLIKNGADANIRAKNNMTALCIAASQGQKSICKLLLAAGAEMNVQDLNGTTALMNANMNGDAPECVAVIKYLIKHGADVNIGKIRAPNFTALAVSARRGHQDACRAMITQTFFNPITKKNEPVELQKKLLLALWALAHAQPHLPKDLWHFIFAKDQELWLTACTAQLHIRTARYDLIHLLPLATIRTLIAYKTLNADATIAALKAHHCAERKPLMAQALPFAQNNEIKALLDTDAMEANFGDEIELQIKKRLQLL
jgi:ankyrin repeat protein